MAKFFTVLSRSLLMGSIAAVCQWPLWLGIGACIGVAFYAIQEDN